MDRYYLRTHQGTFLALFKVFDLLLFSSAGVAALILLEFTPEPFEYALIVIAAMAFHILASATDLYQPWRGMKLRLESGLVLLLTVLACAATLPVALVTGFADGVSVLAQWLTAWWAGAALLMLLLRFVLRPGLKTIRRLGFNQRSIVFVGLCDHTLDFIAELKEHPEFGYRIMGYVDDREAPRITKPISVPRLGAVEELERICQELDIDQVWMDFPMEAQDRVRSVLGSLSDWPVGIRHILQMNSVSPLCGSLTGILGTPMLDVDLTATDGWLTNFIKNVSDRFIAAIVLLLLSPLLAAIAITIKLTSPGPIIYRQERLTWRNRPFQLMKFRSMPVDAEADTGPRWAQPGEDRATPFGAFLRSTSLDELPQFWNVLKGDMSIVGPRPERPEFVEEFRKDIPHYMKKHRVKAGITGWAQVNGLRGDTDLNQRIEHDLYYIRNSSFLLDVKIMLLTVLRGFTDRNAY